MPALGILLQALFGGVVAFFSQYVTRKVAVGMTAAGVFTALTAALYATLTTALSGLAWSLPSWPGMELALWVAAPPNLPVAVAAVLAADAVVSLYKINTSILVMVANS